MKKFFFVLLILCLFIMEGTSQLSVQPNLEIPTIKSPLQYHGILDVGALFVFREDVSSLEGVGGYASYYIAQKKYPIIMGGFGYRVAFQKQLADATDYNMLEALENLEHISFHQHYFSGRVRMQTHRFLINPYAAIGAGWLLQAHTGVSDVPNENYDPNHTCPEGSPLTIREFDNLKIQHQLAYDVEAGILIGKGNVKAQIGIAYMKTQQPTDYPIVSNSLQPISINGEPRHIFIGDQSEATLLTQNTLGWKQQKRNPLMLKLGVSFRIFSDPNIVHTPAENECNCCHRSYDSSSSDSDSDSSSSSRCGR